MSTTVKNLKMFYGAFFENKERRNYKAIFELCRDLSGCMKHNRDRSPEMISLLGSMLAYLAMQGQRLPNLQGYFDNPEIRIV